MAGFLYDKGREAFLGTASQINWTNDTIKAVLVSGTYSPNSSSDQFVGGVIDAKTGSLTAQTLGTKTTTAGVADAADVTFTAVPTGGVWNYVALFKDSGNPFTSQLIALLDSGSATGLPLTSSGADITIQWNNSTNKIFKL